MNKFILGYRHPSCKLFRTDLKPLGYVVGALATGCFIVAAIPNGLGAIFYPLSFGLFSLIGINVFVLKKNIFNKVRYELNLKKMRLFR